MTQEEIKAIIRQEMPEILQDREMRDYIVRSVNNYNYPISHENLLSSTFQAFCSILRLENCIWGTIK